jgi:hypothetical protein
MVHYRLPMNNPFMQATDANIRGTLIRDIQYADQVLRNQGMTINSYVYSDYRVNPAQKYLLIITRTPAGDLDVTNAVTIP